MSEITSDKYIVSYLESIMGGDSIPQISKIKSIFDSMSREDFLRTLESIVSTRDSNSFHIFLYYIIIFRDLDVIRDTLNDSETPIDLLENLVMFAIGHCGLQGYSTERILDEILGFLTKERLLDLILKSRHVSRDKLLLFFILTKLTNDELNEYFSKQKDLSSFVECFLKLPDEVMKSIITRNYHLFQYVMVMMSEKIEADESLKKFYAKYHADIEQMSLLGDVIRKYKSNANLDSERGLPFGERNMGRIAFLVYKIRNLPDQIRAIEYFAGEGLFADENERQVIREIVTNPMFKSTFLHYDSLFDKN